MKLVLTALAIGLLLAVILWAWQQDGGGADCAPQDLECQHLQNQREERDAEHPGQ